MTEKLQVVLSVPMSLCPYVPLSVNFQILELLTQLKRRSRLDIETPRNKVLVLNLKIWSRYSLNPGLLGVMGLAWDMFVEVSVVNQTPWGSIKLGSKVHS